MYTLTFITEKRRSETDDEYKQIIHLSIEPLKKE